MQSKVAREMGRVVAGPIRKRASAPVSGRRPPVTKVAREMGRVVAEAELTKSATDAAANLFVKIASSLGKQAGLGRADIKDMISRLNIDDLLEKVAHGAGMQYGQQYGMPGMQYGGGGGHGGSYGPQSWQAPGGVGHDPSDTGGYETRGLFSRIGDFFTGGESPQVRRAREQAKANKLLGIKPGRGGPGGGGGGKGGWAGGGGGGALIPRGAQRMGARSGIDMASWGADEGYLADMMRGNAIRQGRSKQWRQLANAGANTWGGQ